MHLVLWNGEWGSGMVGDAKNTIVVEVIVGVATVVVAVLVTVFQFPLSTRDYGKFYLHELL